MLSIAELIFYGSNDYCHGQYHLIILNTYCVSHIQYVSYLQYVWYLTLANFFFFVELGPFSIL